MSGAKLKGERVYVVRILCALAVLALAQLLAYGQRAEGEALRPKFGISLLVFSNEGRQLAVVRGNLDNERFDQFDSYNRYSGYYGYNSEVEVWDLTTGKLRQRLKEFRGPILAVAFTPDGKRLATGSWESFEEKPVAKSSEFRRTFGVVKVWDLDSGGLAWSQKAYSTDVSAVAFTPDGRWLATGGTRRAPNFLVGEVKVWDADTGKLKRTLEYRTPVSCIAFSPDGRWLAVRKNVLNESKGEIKLCNVETWKEERTLKADKGITLVDSLRSVEFSPDGKVLALVISGLEGDEKFNEIQLWDVSGGKLKRSLTIDKNLVKGMDKAPKQYWRLASRFLPPNRPVASIAFSADGRTVASVDNTIDMKAWDIESGEVKTTIRSQGEVASVALSPDGSAIAVGEFDNNVRLWETSTGNLKQTLTGAADWTGTLAIDNHIVSVDSILSVAFSPDGKTLACAASNKAVRLLDAAYATEKMSLRGHEQRVSSLAILPDNSFVLSGSNDQTLRLWNAETGEVVKIFAGHTDAITSVAASSDSKLFASGSLDRSIKIWDAMTGEVKFSLRGHDDAVSSVAFSPDGKTVASASLDGTVRLWDAHSGQPKPVIVKHQGAVFSVAFSPDGKTLASGGLDKTVRLWDAASGELKRTMTGHELRVNAVAFSPDGSLIASGSDDKTVRLWYTDSGSVRRALKGHDISVYCVGFSPDGKTLACGSGNNSLVIWDWQTGEMKRVLKDTLKIQVRGQREN